MLSALCDLRSAQTWACASSAFLCSRGCNGAVDSACHASRIECAWLRGVPSIHNGEHLIRRPLKCLPCPVLGYEVGEGV